MLRNVKDAWVRAMVQERDDVVLIDAAILGPPQVWEASGHLSNFTDPLVDCTNCKNRFRLDKLEDPNTCPSCGKHGTFTEARQFNLMFKTHAGPGRGLGRRRLPAPGDGAGHVHELRQRAADDAQEAAVRHRPGRQVVPQRDHAAELDLPDPRVRADGDGVLRAAGRRAPSGTSTGATSASTGTSATASPPTSCACARTTPTSCRTTPSGTSDVEFLFPWGFDELEGIAQRTDFDLKAHAERSGERLDYFDQASGERYMPYVIEPAAGATRTMAAFLLAAYDEDVINGEDRTVLRLHPRLAPYQVAVLPLSRRTR